MALSIPGSMYVKSLMNPSQFAGAKIPDDCMVKTGVGRLQYSYVISATASADTSPVNFASFGFLYGPYGFTSLWSLSAPTFSTTPPVCPWALGVPLQGTATISNATVNGTTALMTAKRTDTQALVSRGLYDEARLVSAEFVVTSSGGPFTDTGVIRACTFNRHLLNTVTTNGATLDENPWVSRNLTSIENHANSVVCPAHQCLRAVYSPQESSDYDFLPLLCNDGGGVLTAANFFASGDEDVADAVGVVKSPHWGFCFVASGLQAGQQFVVNCYLNFEGLMNQTSSAVIPMYESPVDSRAVYVAKKMFTGKNMIQVGNAITASQYRMGPSFGVVPGRYGPRPRGRVNRLLYKRKFRRRYRRRIMY